MTLVAAPAGFGKTTLLSTWVKECGSPAAWISLSEEDNEPVFFMTYLTAALQKIDITIGQGSLVMLQGTLSPAPRLALQILINELFNIPNDFFLILDDYHSIDNPEIHAVISYFLENLPPKMHIVLATRSDPPLPISRLRVRGQITELRQADLRFSPIEAAEFLNQSIGLTLTSDQVAALDSRTEGWIAGLQLAALSLSGHAEFSTFLQEFTGSHRFVIDYLAEEILSQQPEELRHFLLDTSILDRFTTDLCDKVSEGTNSKILLRQLEENNLFLLPLDEHREWYRYHHLFSDFLRSELADEHLAVLHKRASDWFLANKLYAEGVKHALASGDMQMAEKSILKAAPEVFNQGTLGILLGWLDELPKHKILDSSELSIYKGFILFLSPSDEKILPYLLAAENNLTNQSPSPTHGKLLSLKAHIALSNGKLDECIQLCQEALKQLGDEEISFRNLTFNVLGQVLELKGDVISAAEVYERAFRLRRRAGDKIGTLVVFTNLIFSLNELAKRQEALSLCKQLYLEVEANIVEGFPLSDVVYLPWSLLSYEENELDLAQEQAERALNILTAVDFAHGILWAQYILARIHLAKGNFAAMLRLTRSGKRLALEIDRHHLHGAWLSALEAQADLQQGNIPKVTRWAEGSGYSPDKTPSHWDEQGCFTFIRFLLVQGRLAETQNLLLNLQKAAQRSGRLRKLITIHLLQALALAAERNTQQALEHVENALQIAISENYRRAFLDEGQQLAPLLHQVWGISPLFVDQLLADFGAAKNPPSASKTLIDPLSPRELEVLEQVAKGLSNRQIAEVLFVTVGTVKKHLNNIFAKLDVNNRTQAVIRAKEINLIQ